MTKRAWIASINLLLMIGAITAYSIQRWGTAENTARSSLLAVMPPDASTVAFVDFADLRRSPFAVELYKWAPQRQVDPEYAEFLRDTGFDYERDLERIAIAMIKRGQDTTLFAVADGRFDRKKMDAYATQAGTRENRGGKEIFSIPVSGSTRKLSLTFLRKDRIAATNDPSLSAFIGQPANDDETRQWRARFERLAGSPAFAVIRQDAEPGSLLATRAPGGMQSPQLSALLDQLQWISIAGKLEGDRLRIVAEGECAADRTVRQLTDLLNGVLLLAQAGLNGPKTRQQLEPKSREAYLEMLRGADVSRIDRGETKSVRLVFDVTPKFLDAARMAVPVAPIASPAPATEVKTAPATKKKKSPSKKQ